MDFRTNSNMVDPKSSEIKSLGNTGSQFKTSKYENSSSTYEGMIR